MMDDDGMNFHRQWSNLLTMGNLGTFLHTAWVTITTQSFPNTYCAPPFLYGNFTQYVIVVNFGQRKLPKLPTVGSTQKLYHRAECRAKVVTGIAFSGRYAQQYQQQTSFIIAPLSSGAMINQRCYHLRHDDQPTDTVRESMYHIVSDGNVHQLHLKLIMHLYALWFNERIFDDVLLGDFNKKHGKDLGRWWNDVVEWHKRQGINGIFIDESADASTTNLPWFHRSFGFPYSRNDTIKTDTSTHQSTTKKRTVPIS